jgi:hypothetical protein
MPADKTVNKLIPRIYKWNMENIGLFFFIKAQQQLFPTLSTKQAMNNYRKFINIDFEDWDDECMRTTYNRLQHEFNEASKTNK